MSKPRVVILGAGFAGITLANRLNKTGVEVLLIDRNNYHTFQPLLYQVATGGLEPDSIAYPVRRILRKYKNIRFQMGEVTGLELENKLVHTSVGTFVFDYLVVGTGSTNNFFAFEPERNSLLPLKSVADALDIRSNLMQNLELAIASQDSNQQKELMNVAIVGGGPAGLEIAGALAEMRRYVLPRDFPQIDFSHMSIYLFEASGKLLGNMSERSSKYALVYLEKLGVQVKLNSKVSTLNQHELCLEDGSIFKTDSIIWTAGVKGNPPEGFSSDQVVADNRITVDGYNRVKGMRDVFAIGDVAIYSGPENPRGLPMLAQVAIQQAKRLAVNIRLDLQGKPMQPFVYDDKGTMATIGRNKAVVDLPHRHFHGAFAWVVWMLVHIVALVGYRNKMMALVGWMSNYLNYDRPLGLIIRPFKRRQPAERPADNNLL